MTALMRDRFQELAQLGTIQTKKGDWILNKRTQIPYMAGITLRTEYTQETHKENFLGETYHYIIQWDTVTCEVKRNGEYITSSGSYIQGYFAFKNKDDADELFNFLTNQ